MREHRRLRGNLTVAAAASALIFGSIAAAAAPARAEGASGLVSGYVGVTQTINVTGFCPGGNVELTASLNGNVITSNAASSDSNGNATILWSPPSIGSVTNAAVQSSLVGSTCGTIPLPNVAISQVPTNSVVTAPNSVTVGVATQITVTVQSQSRSVYAPTGSVIVKDANGGTIQTLGLTPNAGGGSSYAYWRWTAPTSGSFTFQAVYSGDSNALTSTSAQDVVIATTSGVPIALSLPPTMTVGVPTTLQANVYPANVQGSVGFTLNGTPISASVPIVNGVAKFQWTPTVAGNVTIGANYTTNQGGTGSTSNQVTIIAGPVSTDVITLTQPGFGTWAPNGVYTVSNGTTINFTATTLSGAAVTLAETGPCQVSGLTLVVDASNATCNLTASSPGGNGYAPVKYGYTVSTGLGTQTAILAAPASGRVNVGKVLTMETPQQGDTNAGQNIVWRITKGKNKICKLGFPSSGAVTLKIIKRGQCSVRGDAPGVANVWAPYVVIRTYQGK